jgi:hypothetical protein
MYGSKLGNFRDIRDDIFLKDSISFMEAEWRLFVP